MLAARAARRPSRRTPRTRRDRFEVVAADALRDRPRVPGPPPTALVANLPYNVSVPVLLHLLAAAARRCERGLVMVQAEVADRLAAPPGLAGLRRPVGQGRLVRRRTPGRVGRPQRLLAGAQRRLRAGRLDAPRAAGRPPPPASRSSRSSTRRSPSGARRCAPPCACWPARPRPPRPRCAHAGVDPMARGEPLDVDAVRPDRRGPRPVPPEAARPRSARVTVRAPAKINLRLGVGAAARRRLPPAGHRLPGDRPVRRRHGHATPTTGRTRQRRPTPTGSTRDVPARRRPTSSIRAAPAARRAPRHRARPRASSIDKGIPVAGGMAGGSADAAAALVALRPAVGPAAPRDEDLLALAAELGSDVPFALVGGTALGTGRGELVDPGADRGDVLVGGACRRAEGLSTPAVYRRVRPAAPRTPRRRRPRSPDDAAGRAARPATPTRLGRGAAQRPRRPPALRLRPELRRAARARARQHGALRGDGLRLRARPACSSCDDAGRTPRDGRRGAARRPGCAGRARRHRPGRRAPTSPE